MPETPEDAALVEAMHETYYRDLNFAVPEAMARVLALVRAHDAPTIATLTASLADAEARAGRAEAALERVREALNRARQTFLGIATSAELHDRRAALEKAEQGEAEACGALAEETPHGR